MLTDRRDECAALEDLLQRIRIGESAVLVLRGEASFPLDSELRLPHHATVSPRRGRRPQGTDDEQALGGTRSEAVPLLHS